MPQSSIMPSSFVFNKIHFSPHLAKFQSCSSLISVQVQFSTIEFQNSSSLVFVQFCPKSSSFLIEFYISSSPIIVQSQSSFHPVFVQILPKSSPILSSFGSAFVQFLSSCRSSLVQFQPISHPVVVQCYSTLSSHQNQQFSPFSCRKLMSRKE